MEEERKSNSDQLSLPVKLIKLLLALIILPFRFLIANPKVFLIILAIAASVGGTIYVARKKPQLLGIQGQSVDQSQEMKEETEKLVKEVGEIIALPEGEIPTLATVTDIEAVKDQTFFTQAQNGDKVLIYSIAKKAYLYRPSEKKIIEVGVVNLSQTQEESQVGEAETKPENDIDKELLLTPSITVTPTLKSTRIPTPTNSLVPTSVQ